MEEKQGEENRKNEDVKEEIKEESATETRESRSDKKKSKKLESEIAELKSKLSEKEAALAAADDQYLRMLAEYDNFRRRSASERDKIYSDAKSDALQNILPVLDNLERATAFGEAEKVLGEDLLSTLYTVAKDVKLQLTFDSATVAKYRLIGYESRILNTEDFEDDTKDAGDVGAGHTVTVCYELILNDTAAVEGEPRDIATLGIRCKAPDALESTPYEYLITEAAITNEPSDDFKYIACVIETAMILNGSRYNAGGVTLAEVAEMLSALDLSGDEYKTKFRSIVEGLANSK